MTDEQPRPSPPTARELVERELEPGEPIEAFVMAAIAGPVADPRAARTMRGVAFASASSPATGYLARTMSIAVTDRRVFFVTGPGPVGTRVEPKKAVRALECDSTGASILLWLNVDGHQIGYRIKHEYRAATDALVHALGGVPPSE